MIEVGYLIRENVFCADECERLIASIASHSTTTSGRAGVRNLMQCEPVRQVAGDARLKEVIRKVRSETFSAYKATLFEKTDKANWLVSWHQDTALPLEQFQPTDGWGATSTKAGVCYAQAPASALSRIVAIRIHLDESTKSNGPLRVLPKSHTFGVLTAAEIDSLVSEIPSEECLVPKGGVLMMSPLLVHASSKGISNEPRRVLHIEYAASRDLDDGIRLAIA
jgi:ectoine hydroxylase-related dioxygenase (phytanoyl-CoA dioxygenase family)